MLWECAGRSNVAAAAHFATHVRQGRTATTARGQGQTAAAAVVTAADRLRRRRCRWEVALTSDKLTDQLWAVQQAEDAARVQGLQAVT